MPLPTPVGCSIFFKWIPGRSNIPGNENINMAAKNPPPSCRTLPFILRSVPKNYLCSEILNLWQNQWTLTPPNSYLSNLMHYLCSQLPLPHDAKKRSFLVCTGHTQLIYSLNVSKPNTECPHLLHWSSVPFWPHHLVLQAISAIPTTSYNIKKIDPILKKVDKNLTNFLEHLTN